MTTDPSLTCIVMMGFGTLMTAIPGMPTSTRIVGHIWMAIGVLGLVFLAARDMGVSL